MADRGLLCASVFISPSDQLAALSGEMSFNVAAIVFSTWIWLNEKVLRGEPVFVVARQPSKPIVLYSIPHL